MVLIEKWFLTTSQKYHRHLLWDYIGWNACHKHFKIIPATVPMNRDPKITSPSFFPRRKSYLGQALTQSNMRHIINDHILPWQLMILSLRPPVCTTIFPRNELGQVYSYYKYQSTMWITWQPLKKYFFAAFVHRWVCGFFRGCQNTAFIWNHWNHCASSLKNLFLLLFN